MLAGPRQQQVPSRTYALLSSFAGRISAKNMATSHSYSFHRTANRTLATSRNLWSEQQSRGDLIRDRNAQGLTQQTKPQDVDSMVSRLNRFVADSRFSSRSRPARNRLPSSSSKNHFSSSYRRETTTTVHTSGGNKIEGRILEARKVDEDEDDYGEEEEEKEETKEEGEEGSMEPAARKRRPRLRSHVNPLRSTYLQTPRFPDWRERFDSLERPLHVDMGSGRGRYLFELAKRRPDWNHLGLEIRQLLIDDAEQLRRSANLRNLAYTYANTMIALPALAASLPPSLLVRRVSILFPDPWFKRRHYKRRMVQPHVVDELARLIAPGGLVLFQTDFLELHEDMIARFSAHRDFLRVPESEAYAIAASEFKANGAVRSEREERFVRINQPILTGLFQRRAI